MPSVPTIRSISSSEPGVRDGPAPVRPDRAGAVRLVDHHARVVALRQLDDALERRHVAVHREDAVGHDQRAAALRLAQPPLEVVHVAVVVDERLGARQPAAVHDAGVVECVGEDDVALAGECGDHSGVRQVARPEQERGLCALEVARAAPRACGGSSCCPRSGATRRSPRRSASPPRRPLRGRAGGQRARGSCSSRAAERACRRGARAAPVGPTRSASAGTDPCS